MATIPWPMDQDTLVEYHDLGHAINKARAENDTLRLEQLLDAFRSLPGYPTGLTDLDTVVPVPPDQGARRVITNTRAN